MEKEKTYYYVYAVIDEDLDIIRLWETAQLAQEDADILNKKYDENYEVSPEIVFKK